MNYLAHAFLSFDDPEILVGNMISDYVKGKKQYDHPETIQKGIRLHRLIDTFTDNHSSTKTAKELLKPAVGAYAGAFIDVVYDHFLAIDKNIYSEEEWLHFTERTYQSLYKYEAHLPERFANMLPYMSSQNWLYNYRFPWGIEKSFEGVARRAVYLSHNDMAFRLFETHYDSFQEAYDNFFPDVKKLALDFLYEERTA